MMNSTTEYSGFAIARAIVPRGPIELALRRLHLEVTRFGLPIEQMREWHKTKCWFPALRQEPEILALTEFIPPEFKLGTLCEPQILFHYPDEAGEWEVKPHVDEPPPWADGRPYESIVGVALSENSARNGGLVVWPFGATESRSIALWAGDMVMMNPNLPHSGSLNRGGIVRQMIYFRYLKD